ncbi:hypothetical protein MRB53_014469 [Persea americana]|uniref:Uncharacterized protein n=1 Tax=Persea americana TaxID=3435 RepID=A0ACC2KBK1_PERAE|nr:hypothetical protein MRB53_014469 [Persea americana]
MEEGIREVIADYKAQLQRIWDQAWELGWKAALRKVGVPGDDPAFRYPPKFPSSGSVLLSIVDPPSASGPSSEAPPAASVVPEACQAISEAALTYPEAVLLEAGAPQGCGTLTDLGLATGVLGKVLSSVTKYTSVWLALLPQCSWCYYRAEGGWYSYRAGAGAVTEPKEAGTAAELQLVLSLSYGRLVLLLSRGWCCHRA